MRVPHLQFTVRRLMIAVAIAATFSAVLTSPLLTPYPTRAMQYGVFTLWLVPGETLNVYKGGLRPLSVSKGSVLVQVKWSDRTETRHLRRPYWLLP